MAARRQRGANFGDRGVEIVDIGQAEVTYRRVEPARAEDARCGNVGVEIADAKTFVLFGFPGLADQVAGDVDAGYLGPAPGQFAGDAPVPAGDVEDAQS